MIMISSLVSVNSFRYLMCLERCLLYATVVPIHGHRKDFFQRGSLEDFSKTFLGGPKVVKFVFSHSKLKNNLFAKIFKI